MSSITAVERYCKAESEVRVPAVVFTKPLRSGEVLTGTPTVPAVSGLTIENVAVNTVALTDDEGRTIPIGHAVQFKVSGGTAGTEYTIAVQCDTDSSPAQTLRGLVVLDVISDT